MVTRSFPLPLRRVDGTGLSSSSAGSLSAGVILTRLLTGQARLRNSRSLTEFDAAILLLKESGKENQICDFQFKTSLTVFF